MVRIDPYFHKSIEDTNIGYSKGRKGKVNGGQGVSKESTIVINTIGDGT
jgi:hypothetical protein